MSLLTFCLYFLPPWVQRWPLQVQRPVRSNFDHWGILLCYPAAFHTWLTSGCLSILLFLMLGLSCQTRLLTAAPDILESFLLSREQRSRHHLGNLISFEWSYFHLGISALISKSAMFGPSNDFQQQSPRCETHVPGEGVGGSCKAWGLLGR